MVYQPDGAYFGTIGHRGAGPGEFESVTAMTVDMGDTIHVFSVRESLFQRDGRFIRTRVIPEVPFVSSALILPGGELAIQANIGSRQRAGLPFHLVRADGTIAKSFGALATENFRLNYYSVRRRIVLASDSTFWAAKLPAYRLELWGLDGQLRRVMERKVDWFLPWDPPDRPVGIAVAPPKPTVVAISLDTRGVLWVLVHVADRNWKPVFPSGGRTERSMSQNEYASLVDTMVEAIDVQTGRVLVSERVPSVLGRFVGPGLTTELVEDSDGVFSLRILRLDVVNQ